MADAPARSSWTAPPTPLEWIAIVVMLAGGVFLALPRAEPPAPPGPGAAMTVETLPNGRRVAHMDEQALQAAFEAAGLPDPPRLDTDDPVPLRKLLDFAEHWTAEHDVDSLAAIGHLYQAIEAHAAAAECFAALVQMDPDNPQWHYHLGIEAQALRQNVLAIEQLERAAQLEADYPTTFARLGLLHLERGDLDLARSNYERCRELLPGRSLGYVGLGRVALAEGDPQRAADHLRTATEMTTNDYVAYRFLAQALREVGRIDEAAKAAMIAEALPHYSGWLVFDERLQSAHRIAKTQRYLENEMRAAMSVLDLERFIIAAEQLLERRPDDHTTLTNLANAYLNVDDIEKADAMSLRALEQSPDSVRTLLVRAQITATMGQRDVALRTIDRALELDPEYSAAILTKSKLLFLGGQEEAGIAMLRDLIARGELMNEAGGLLVTMLLNTDRLEEAASVLRQLVERNPDDARLREQLEQLQNAIGSDSAE